MVTSPAARPDAIRRHNLSLVLGHIHRDGALTRAELTQRLKVSRSTMGALVADLLELGLVGEVVPSGGSSVGRPSHVVGPHAKGPYVAAVDIDVNHVVTAAVGLGGDVLARTELPTGGPAAAGGDPRRLARLVVESVEQLAAATGRNCDPISVGVSVPGTVDRTDGRVMVAPNLDWRDVAFGQLLSESFAASSLHAPTPIHLGNDADLAVMAEHLRGAARGFDDVVYLIGRVGVGAGIVVNGQQLRGCGGNAGEIGHNVIDATGKPCHCGKNGCTETFIGEGALLAAAGRPLPPTDDEVASFFAAARDGDQVAVRAVREVAAPLGRTIAMLINTLNPRAVLLGGTLSQLLELAREDIEASLAHYALEAPLRAVELITPHFGNDSPLLGAAELAFAALLEDPLVAAG